MTFDINKERIPTFFAPPERATDDELQYDIQIISQNPVVDGVMQTTGGLLAVLNEHRQILAVNDTFLRLLNCEDVKNFLGLRPGEAVNCIYAEEMPGGCGTSKYCETCGAAIAIVTSLSTDVPEERTCAMTVNQGEWTKDIYFSVRSVPMLISKRKFILLFLQDITQQHQWAALQRVFFHDLSNLAMGLIGASEMVQMDQGNERGKMVKRIHQMSLRFSDEIALQKALSNNDFSNYSLNLHTIRVASILQDIHSFFSQHPASTGKTLLISEVEPDLQINTDPSIVIRILSNMVTNALEATTDGGEVKLYVGKENDSLTFCVWNKSVIPDAIARRIFQRHFSTKKEPGRGLGTFSMKFLAENYLNGKVDFTTSVKTGTTFRLRLKRSNT
mgnify:CR=1 FL=1